MIQKSFREEALRMEKKVTNHVQLRRWCVKNEDTAQTTDFKKTEFSSDFELNSYHILSWLYSLAQIFV